MSNKPARLAGVISMIVGLLFVITGGVTWGIITGQLAAENITVPKDAAFMQGAKVQDPLSAYAQADIINHHALAASEGKTYAELGALATQAKNDGDTALADKYTQQRTTVMTASFLRASLFTSILAYGVALFAIGVGVVMLLVGWALTSLSRPAVAAATVRE